MSASQTDQAGEILIAPPCASTPPGRVGARTPFANRLVDGIVFFALAAGLVMAVLKLTAPVAEVSPPQEDFIPGEQQTAATFQLTGWTVTQRSTPGSLAHSRELVAQELRQAAFALGPVDLPLAPDGVESRFLSEAQSWPIQEAVERIDLRLPPGDAPVGALIVKDAFEGGGLRVVGWVAALPAGPEQIRLLKLVRGGRGDAAKNSADRLAQQGASGP
jgi:hypothetical protein